MGYVKVNERVDRNIEYVPCVKCGSENIDFGDCGYSSFNIAWGKCKDCNHEVKISNCLWDISTEEIISIWNDKNDPEKLRTELLLQINKLQALINALPKKSLTNQKTKTND